MKSPESIRRPSSAGKRVKGIAPAIPPSLGKPLPPEGGACHLSNEADLMTRRLRRKRFEAGKAGDRGYAGAMSERATQLIQLIESAPVSVQREVAAAVLERQFGGGSASSKPRGSLLEVAGRYHSSQPLPGAARHDAWFVEAIQASKSEEPTA